MFDEVQLSEKGLCILKLVSPRRIEGGAKQLLQSLRTAVQHPQVMVDFSDFREFETGVGVGLALFFEQRRGVGKKTRVFGLTDALRKEYGEECFSFIEPDYWVEDEERAINELSQ